MKPIRAALVFAFLLIALLSHAQTLVTIPLRSGTVAAMPNVRAGFVDSFNRAVPRLDGKTVALLVFGSLPTTQAKLQLEGAGIYVHNFVSPGVYTATFSDSTTVTALQQAGVKALVPLQPAHKIDPLLAGGRIPARSIKVPGVMDAIISIPSSFEYSAVEAFLAAKQIDIVSGRWRAYGKLTVRFVPNRLQELAAFPFVEYVEASEPELELFNSKSRAGSRANVLNASAANGGMGLNGEGVVIGIGDNAAIYSQADFSGRYVERNTNTASHGIHVAGTAAGGGIVNELHRGYAPKAGIVNALQTDILSGIYVQDHRMVVTNNSYGAGFSCDYNGLYEAGAFVIDQMAVHFPSLLNVFGAGNYGTGTCAPYPPGFNTITSAWQAGKNAIAVGATTDSGDVVTFSSRGPAKDGRIKPEIVAMGNLVTSVWPNNIYANNAGTSMSAPAVAGGLALLYQRYRQLHGGADPKNGLMKAILCNGAADRGNPGPDYTYGFGWMNLLRSVDMLNAHRHITANASHNTASTHLITVPAGTAQLKVMLYWNDPASSVFARQALVNDLDLEVATPSGGVVLPFVLDTVPANVNKPATTGADHINNIEQVVVDNPPAGNYTLRVKGTAIVQNPSQEYFLVYDIIPVSVVLTNPTGGEGLAPGEPLKITWDAYGNADKKFTLQFSSDNGASWTEIANGLAAGRRIYTWQVPATITSNGLVRIVQEGTGLSATSRPFTIIGLPVVTLSPIQCETYIAIDWTPVAGAGRYEVMSLDGDEMKVIDTTSSLYYKFTGLNRENLYWVAVRPIINGKAGRRSVAISRRPDSGNCSGSISDNDLMVEALLSPATGRKFTSSALGAATTVRVRIKNLDDAAAAGFSIAYSLNNGPWITENIAATIAAGGTYDHSFAAAADLSAVGAYNIRVAVRNNTADATTINDTLPVEIRQLDNQPLNLSATFLDDVETAAPETYVKDITGLKGVDRYDFQSVTKSGQVTTFFNTGFSASGSKAFIMGETWQHSAIGLNYLTGTFNLGNYRTAANTLRADFKYINTHFSIANMALWARGADTQPWIKVFDMTRTPDTFYRRTPSIAIADSLAKYGQDFTSSFQLRWGNATLFQSYDKRRMHGIDDIRLYEVTHDVQALRLDTPVAMSCNVSGNVPVILRVHNSHFTALSNVPVKYSVNGGQWVEEFIASIPAKTTMQYTFSQLLNMNANGSYTIRAAVAYPMDNFRENDTVVSAIQSSVLVSSFPHLQNFESGVNGWYASGQNISWEYGTPASPKIKGAASGAKAWKTRLAGHYNDNELSYLYSPCFAIGGLGRPMLSMSMALDLGTCQALPCDAVWIEYTTNGTAWVRLGSSGAYTNWYNTTTAWSGIDYSRWHVATYGLPTSPTGLIRFRVVMSSNGSGNHEGIAIDDVHVYDVADNNPFNSIYDSASMTVPVTQTVSGDKWTDFRLGGRLLASVHPHGQDLGATSVQVYIDSGSARNNGVQYYHNRNLALRSAKQPTDSVTVRFYFLDTETDSLIYATGCPGCAKPSSAYQLGVSSYNDPVDSIENGTIDDNKTGSWHYIPSLNVVKAPYDRGYYVAFKVKDMTELWLNNGGHDLNSHLGTPLITFTAQRAGARDVVLHWTMGNETGIARYEIEMALSNAAVQANQFNRIGTQPANASRNYTFTDTDPGKFDTVYYRLKLVYNDGRSAYSPVRQVIFAQALPWKLYPNPSAGKFYLDYPTSINQTAFISLFDAKGSLIRNFTRKGNGFMQRMEIDLSHTAHANGVYLLRIMEGGESRTFKLYKR